MYRPLILLPNELVRTNKLYMYICYIKKSQKNFILIFREMKKKDFQRFQHYRACLGYRLTL